MSASSSLSVTTAPSGTWNAAWDIGFDPTQDPTGAAQVELMVWLNKQGAGLKVSSFSASVS